MYIGHLAIALGAARVRRQTPMLVLLVASQWPDWVQLSLGALGAYNAQLYSHSVPAIIGGALLFSLLFLRWSGDWRSTLLVASVYLTHPLLDLVTGQKVLWPGGPIVGANLYDQPALDFVLESAFVLVGWWVYRSSFARPRRERRLLFLLLALIGCQGVLDAGQQLRLLRVQAIEIGRGSALSLLALPR